MLAADGKATLSIAIPQAEFPTAREVEISAEVTDANNQTLTSTAATTVHPASVYIGVSRIDSLVRAGDAVPLKIIATDTNGEPFPGAVKVTTTLTREVNSAVKSRTESGATTTRNNVEEELVTTDELTLDPSASAGQGTSFTVTPKSTGRHFLTVRGTDPEGRAFATTTYFNAYGTKEYPWLYEDGLRVIAPHLPYPVRCREMTGKPDDVVSVGPLRVTAAWAEHEIPCLAYRFDLPRARPFLPENAKALGLPVAFWKQLQRGETITYEGKTHTPDDVLGPPRPGLSVGFVTDTRPTQQLVEFVTDVDLLICEAMYGDPADLPKALENKHMVFAESATMGAASRARQLWLTHYSPALPFPEQYRAEAERVYPGVVLGREMMSTTIAFPD